jgi:RNA polymerase sigma-70 factor (ECF subfamily)
VTTYQDDFERRVRENQRVVYQIAYGVLGNAADAEDIAQETFVRAFTKLGSLRERESFRAWVLQISRRLALNRVRANARARLRESRALADEALAVDVEAFAQQRAFAARVRREIDGLPDALRSVLLLCAIEGLDQASVARIEQIPEGTVRSRLHAARKHLLKALQE